MKGETFIVNQFYADVLKGTEGVCVKRWTAKGQEWIKLDFGKNQSGQKLQKSFPIDVLKKRLKNIKKTGSKRS